MASLSPHASRITHQPTSSPPPSRSTDAPIVEIDPSLTSLRLAESLIPSIAAASNQLSVATSGDNDDIGKQCNGSSTLLPASVSDYAAAAYIPQFYANPASLFRFGASSSGCFPLTHPLRHNNAAASSQGIADTVSSANDTCSDNNIPAVYLPNGFDQIKQSTLGNFSSANLLPSSALIGQSQAPLSLQSPAYPGFVYPVYLPNFNDQTLRPSLNPTFKMDPDSAPKPVDGVDNPVSIANSKRKPRRVASSSSSTLHPGANAGATTNINTISTSTFINSSLCKNQSNVAANGKTIVKRHHCSDCPKSFQRSSDLAKHRRTHTGEKPYACAHCGRAFSDSSSLAAHRRIHTGERPYACQQCDKAFAVSSSLTKHKRTHSGERPYRCPCCWRSFSDNSSFRAHARRSQKCAEVFKIDMSEPAVI